MAPIDIPYNLLHKWQKTLTDFIWSPKQSRIDFDKGGLSVPDIKLYYEAAYLTQIIQTLSEN